MISVPGRWPGVGQTSTTRDMNNGISVETAAGFRTQERDRGRLVPAERRTLFGGPGSIHTEPPRE